MKKIETFHGSDLEKISEYYNIPQESIVNFAANVNPLGLSSALKEELAKNLDILSSYPDREYTSLRNSIATYCNTNSDYILVGNGSTELISLLISNIKAKKALLLGPTYSEYEKELSLVDCTLEEYKLAACDNFQLDLDKICLRLGDEFDFLILCNPNNPTGSALTVSQLHDLIGYCKSHGIFVMIDETYIEFASDIQLYSAIPLADTYDNLMVLRGVSKFYAAPGLRMGYGITSNMELRAHLKKHQNPWSLNSIAAFAVEKMFADSAYIEQTRALILQEKKKCMDFFVNRPEYKVYDTEANFILIQILDPEESADSVFDKCIRQGLMIRNCNSFFGDDGEFVRFCFMLPEDNTRLLNQF